MEYDVPVHCHHQKMCHVGFFQHAAATYRQRIAYHLMDAFFQPGDERAAILVFRARSRDRLHDIVGKTVLARGYFTEKRREEPSQPGARHFYPGQLFVERVELRAHPRTVDSIEDGQLGSEIGILTLVAEKRSRLPQFAGAWFPRSPFFEKRSKADARIASRICGFFTCTSGIVSETSPPDKPTPTSPHLAIENR